MFLNNNNKKGTCVLQRRYFKETRSNYVVATPDAICRSAFDTKTNLYSITNVQQMELIVIIKVNGSIFITLGNSKLILNVR